MNTSKLNRKYGWIHSLPDARDRKFDHELLMRVAALPAMVNPLTAVISAYDQGDVGSCTGNGCGRLAQSRHLAEKLPAPMPSRAFIYALERQMEGTLNQDSGAQVRDGLKVLAKYGVCPEAIWPYDMTFDRHMQSLPSAAAMAAAKKFLALQYQSVACNLMALKAALAAGNPVVGGFTVFESFESQAVADTGIMPMPKRGEQVMGGHCVVWDGYNDAGQFFWCANSWGTSWGASPNGKPSRGWFKMPYANLINCSDFWVLLKEL